MARGFVMVRCTYPFQENRDKCVAFAKGHASGTLSGADYITSTARAACNGLWLRALRRWRAPISWRRAAGSEVG